LFIVCSVSAQRSIKPSEYVDPMIGTGGHGHTFPGATVPFGMVQLSPDTRIDGSWMAAADIIIAIRSFTAFHIRT